MCRFWVLPFLLALVGAVSAQPVQDARFAPPAGGEFGGSVAFSGDRALVGASAEADGQPFSGAAYVFVRTDDGWEQEARLVDPDGPGYYGFFGVSVALSGDRAFVTDHTWRWADSLYQGAVHVFVRTGQTWTYESRLDGPVAFELFGRSVSASDDHVLVGALIEDRRSRLFSGAAYLFARSGTVWTHEATLKADDLVEGDQFGMSVSLLGDRALVGASHDSTFAPGGGAAYLFSRAGSGWMQEAKLSPSSLSADDQFGASVSLGEGRAVVGAPARTCCPVVSLREGAAYTFARSPDGTWAQEGRLSGPIGSGFGASVSLMAGQMLVGAPYELDTGAAHLFSRTDGAWQQTGVLAASDGAAEDLFGYAVALSDGRALVGANGVDRGSHLRGGVAYVFSGLGATGAEGEPELHSALSHPQPNPASGRAVLTLTLDAPQHVRATVLDALGRTVAVVLDAEASGETRLDVDTARLAPGVYVVRVAGEAFAETRQLTVVR